MQSTVANDGSEEDRASYVRDAAAERERGASL
jgi:hypothetical protein